MTDGPSVSERGLRSKARSLSQSPFARFVLTGGLNSGVHFCLFALLEALGAPVAAANATAFLCANIFGFFMASYFVFRVRVRGLVHYARFLCVSLVGVALSWGIGALCVRLELHPYFSVLGVVVLLPPISYVLQRMVFVGRGPN